MTRQLDAWVAEYVMGYDRVDVDGVVNTWFARFSTDMNAAMEVANKFDMIIIKNVPINLIAIECIWDVAIIHQKKNYWVTHDSLPTAICLTALRAVGRDDLVDEYLGGEG